METTKFSPEQIKKNQKVFFKTVLISSLIVLGIFFLYKLAQPPTLKSAKSVNEAKKVIDYFIREWDDTYNSLCKEPRNDNLKSSFNDLQEGINSINGCGEKCINLSYSQQNEVSSYAIQRLKQNKSLMYLYNYNKIECW